MAGEPVNAGRKGGTQKPDIRQVAAPITVALGRAGEPIVDALRYLDDASTRAVGEVKETGGRAAVAAFTAGQKADAAVNVAAGANNAAKAALDATAGLNTAVDALGRAVQEISGRADAAGTAASAASATAAGCKAAVDSIPQVVEGQLAHMLRAEVAVLDGDGVKSVPKSGGDLVTYLAGEVSRLTGLLGAVITELADIRVAFQKRVGELETAVGVATANLQQAEAANAGLQASLERVIAKKVDDLSQDGEVHKGRLARAEAALRTVLGDGYEAATVLNELALQAMSPLVVSALREDNYREAVMDLAGAVGKGNVRSVLEIFANEEDLHSIKLALAREKDIYYVSHLERPENATIKVNIERRAPYVQARAKECLADVVNAIDLDRIAARKQEVA